MHSKTPLPHPVINKIIRFFIKTPAMRLFALQEGINEAKDIDYPFLLLSNHSIDYDFIFVHFFLKKPVCFLSTVEWFRNPFLRELMYLFGTIPKTKALADYKAVRRILNIRDSKQANIGVFVTIGSNWDGATDYLAPGTEKLVKKLEMPVVCSVFQGGYLTQPRWSDFRRRGKIIANFYLTLTPEEIRAKSTEEIREILSACLFHDEYAWQEQSCIEYPGKKKAERIERLLYICPCCHTMWSIRSEGDRFYCNACGASAVINIRGVIASEDDNNITFAIPHPRAWNLWQKEFLTAKITNEDFIAKDNDITGMTGGKTGCLIPLGRGKLQFSNSLLTFTGADNRSLLFYPEKMQGLNIHNRDRLIFYIRDTLYSFTFNGRYASPCGWLDILELTREMRNRH